MHFRIAVVSRYSIRDMVSLSWLQFPVSHNTTPCTQPLSRAQIAPSSCVTLCACENPRRHMSRVGSIRCMVYCDTSVLCCNVDSYIRLEIFLFARQLNRRSRPIAVVAQIIWRFGSSLWSVLLTFRFMVRSGCGRGRRWRHASLHVTLS